MNLLQEIHFKKELNASNCKTFFNLIEKNNDIN